MPSNEERSEIASRLRDMAPGSDWPKYVAEACGMDISKMSNHFHTYTAQLCQRLADLIEPEPERTCKWELKHGGTIYDVWKCSICGFEYAENRCDNGVTDFDPNYCPNCGAKVVGE